MTRTRLTLKSANRKTGPIPVSTTSSDTCPEACPLRGNGCYAEGGALAIIWSQVNSGKAGDDWQTFCGKIAALPQGQLWRHNQAGDLPGPGDAIDAHALRDLVQANKGKRGFTYTHKPVKLVSPHGPEGAQCATRANNNAAVHSANYHGFTVNLSANNVAHADELASLEIAPVVAVLPSDVQGNVKVETPAGRRVVVCPATYRDDVTCASCKLCAVRDRKVIVGFPAHGSRSAKADAIAQSE